MATAQEIIDGIIERIRATAKVETIYGEPQTHHGRTVIPVAKVSARGGLAPAAATGPSGATTRPRQAAVEEAGA